jgi:hypothetical protein
MPGEVVFGPWAKGILPAERRARLRELRALAHVIVGPEHEFTVALRDALTDREAVKRAGTALRELPMRTMRRLLASYAALHRPPKARKHPA